MRLPRRVLLLLHAALAGALKAVCECQVPLPCGHRQPFIEIGHKQLLPLHVCTQPRTRGVSETPVDIPQEGPDTPLEAS